MPWTITQDAGEFLAAAGEFLRARPVEHTLPLTVAERLRHDGPAAFGAAKPLLGWWTGGGPTAGAFVLTPPFPLTVTQVPDDALPALADVLATAAPALGAIGAPRGTAEQFAGQWHARTGATARVRHEMRLYRLGTLAEPDPVPSGH